MSLSERGIERVNTVIGTILEKPKAFVSKRTPPRPLRARDQQPLTRDGLFEHARMLALEHELLHSGKGSRRLYRRFSENTKQLDSAYQLLGEAALNKEFLTPGAEWLLDNYHIIQLQIQDIKKHFPRGYDRTLPKLVRGPFTGYPRVYQLAIEFLVKSDAVISAESVTSFIEGYQSETPLAIGEGWAVPIMLRFALIENLASLAGRMLLMREERKVAESLIDEIVGDESQAGTQILLELAGKLVERPDFLATGAPYLLRRLRERGRKASLTVQWLEERLREDGLEPEEVLRNEQYFLAADQISIGNSFNSLRAINYIDWKDWFESVNRVQSILGNDPAGFYLRGDFKTRDFYRREVELLAIRSKVPEIDVASKLIETAARELKKAQDEGKPPLFQTKRGHIGYYLIGDGRKVFEKVIGCTPPPARRIGRFLKEHPGELYIGLVVFFSALLAYQPLSYALEAGAGPLTSFFVGAISVILASEIGIHIAQWVITRFLAPNQLPKLDLKRGVPNEFRTAVVLQAIFPDEDSVARTFDGLEVRYLANPERNLIFGILADFADADAEVADGDAEILARAAAELENVRSLHPQGKFFILFRHRKYNPAQGRYMAWERKRGKIEEFNRLILGRGETSFMLDDFDPALVSGIRYVITLDNDSQLPREVAKKLIGTIAHPMNAALIESAGSDGSKSRVVDGYSIVQPRMSVSLMSGNASRFAHICAGESGLDPYTQTVSELYQDLFHQGSFIGKGIYDVAAFSAALEGRVPENALLSHDLFEGNFAHTALASDVELFDDFPSRYHVHARRLHRWVRGDWQLLPWLFARVPESRKRFEPNEISGLGRWKLFDNLRRSLVAPALFLFFVAATTFLPGPLSYWLLVFVSVIVFQVYLNIAQAFFVPARSVSFRNQVRGLGKDLVLTLKRAALFLCFLPHQSWLMVDAIAVTLWRVFVSKKHLLEWETASFSERRLGSSMKDYFRELFPGLVLSAIALAALVQFAPDGIGLTFPIFLLWFSAPAVAKKLSDPIPLAEVSMTAAEREYLTDIAWKTWRYFRSHLTPEHNHLIPDNVQLTPARVVAGRTSPTNVSLSMLSAISAYDCGFIALHQAEERVRLVFETLGRLERYRGHFLNWYNTRTLDPLLPRYVSFVDSGNLVGHLIAIRSFASRGSSTPIIHAAHLAHVRRVLEQIKLLCRKVCRDSDKGLENRIQTLITKLSPQSPNIEYLAAIIKEIRAIEDELPNAVHRAGTDEDLKVAADHILELDTELDDISATHEILRWFEEFARCRQSMGAESHSPEVSELLKQFDELANREGYPTLELLDSLVSTALKVVELSAHSSDDPVYQALGSALDQIARARKVFEDISIECSKIIESVDFTFLYDSERELFAIGYDVGNARRDTSYYDLLASEARLGSLVAIALGQIPQEHWFALGRPLADTPGGKALMSWGGTMFEYLMPLSMTRDFPGTILSETFRAVVKSQAAYGRRMGVPWGVSESGYSGVDFEKTYQYHAFGVPGLGLKRGLEEDLVISPYSTFMALPINFRSSFDNLKQLEREGSRGEYGFFEAIDYTPSRLSNNEKHHLVSSFFAHHQGMSLVSLNNTLNSGILQDRFHSDQLIKATELLLQEKFPDRVSIIVPATAHLYPIENVAEENEGSTIQSYTTPHTAFPYTHLLSNGRYAVMLDNAGSGWSVFERDIQLTRWREDAFNNSLGTYIYVQDLESNNVWSATYQPTLVEPESYESFFGPDKIEFKRRDHDIFIHSEITVSPEDNVEVRRISLTNLSSERRTLQLTSYGEVVIAPQRADASHPAFSKMFVESESLTDLDALLFHRRPRSKHEQPLFMLHMVTQRLVWDRVQTESSRTSFLGRGRSVREPFALDPGRNLTDTVGYVLDPIFSLRTKVEIDPGKTEVVTFITAVAPQREEILALAARYREVHQISRAFEMAWSQSSVELRNEQTAARQWQSFQKLGNALIYNVERMRAKSDVLARNRLAQSGLWRFGISGDFPICLVRITEPDQSKLALEALHAHQYLRVRGLVFELVILNEYPGGYLQNLQEELEYLIRSSASGALAEKRGGVFLRTAQQLSEEEKDLLHTVSRIILSGARGALPAQVKIEEKPLAPTLLVKKRLTHKPHDSVAGIRKLSQYNGFGGFLDSGHGYAIEAGENLPPLPWSNVISNPTFGFLVTEIGAGYTWSENCRENRITPWSNDPVTDPFGEVLYIRDTATGLYWTPTPGPVRSGATYRVEHQIGRSVFLSNIEKIDTRFEVTVAPEERTKVYRLKLRNGDTQTRKLEFFFYAEWTLGVSRDETSRYVITDFEEESQCLTAMNYYNADFAGRVYFVGSDQNVFGHTASRGEFLGRNRDLSSPVALDGAVRQHGGRGFLGSSIKLYGRTGCGFDPCAVLRVSADLAAGAETTIHFFLGELMPGEKLAARTKKVREEVLVAKTPDNQIPEPFGSLVSAVQVQTPEPTFDLLVNGWLLYQTVSARINARTGYYQSGGAFGFRDQLQDVLALLTIEPKRVRDQLLLHASRQFPEGDVQHWWHPPSGKGVRTRISDDFLWLPYVAARYIESTGDWSVLDEEVRFIDGPKLAEHEMETYIIPSVSSQSAPLLEHCIRAIQNGMKFGAHGLPLMGGGDWNDGMNEVGREGKGESVWLGWFLGLVLKTFIPILRERNRTDLVDQDEAQINLLRECIEGSSWDGAWYRRAYFDDGAPLGSAQNDECQIDSIAQSWSVISGMGQPDRARTALHSARERLVDKELRLVKLLSPPFDKGIHHPGYIKGYLPGVRENGGQYTHAAVWLSIAHAVIGDGDLALQLFQMINPIEHTKTAEGVARYRGEPYALCGDVYAVDPYRGRAGWSWYTGSAGWMLQAGMEYILGLKLRADHFLVEPCVPKAWKKFSLQLRVHGVLYRVEIENPNGVTRGVQSVTVDGVKQSEAKIPLLSNGSKREVGVTVTLG